jgi:hypothetical protein
MGIIEFFELLIVCLHTPVGNVLRLLAPNVCIATLVPLTLLAPKARIGQVFEEAL